MAQFDIVKSKTKSSKTVPYFLILQTDSLSDLGTSIVAPLRPIKKNSAPKISKIQMEITITGREHLAYLSEMAAIPTSALGQYVTTAKDRRTEIISALDFIFTGF
jgi:toxin CcdB